MDDQSVRIFTVMPFVCEIPRREDLRIKVGGSEKGPRALDLMVTRLRRLWMTKGTAQEEHKETREESGSVWMEEEISIEAEEMSENLVKHTKCVLTSLLDQARGTVKPSICRFKALAVEGKFSEFILEKLKDEFPT